MTEGGETGDAPPEAPRDASVGAERTLMRFARRRDDPVGRRSEGCAPEGMLTLHPIDARGARSG